MKWVLCEQRSDEWEDIAINSDTIKNVLLISNPKFWSGNHYAEGDDKYKGGRNCHDEPGDIIIETNDGKFYRFFDGGTGWDEFQDPFENSIIIYQRLLQTLGSDTTNGCIIVPTVSDETPVYRSRKVVVLFDFRDISKVEYDKNGCGVYDVEDRYDRRLDQLPFKSDSSNGLRNGCTILKKEVE